LPNPYIDIFPRTELLSQSVALQAHPSPTTGKFPFIPNGDSRSMTFISEAPDRSKDDLFEDINNTSFAFRPVAEPGSSFFFGASSKVIKL
jgi:WRKY transcription factor 2